MDVIHKGCRRFIMELVEVQRMMVGSECYRLGIRFLDKDGNQIKHGAIGLKDLAKIKDDHVISELKDCEFHIACDVIESIMWRRGCSAILVHKEGATEADGKRHVGSVVRIMQNCKNKAFYKSRCK